MNGERSFLNKALPYLRWLPALDLGGMLLEGAARPEEVDGGLNVEEEAMRMKSDYQSPQVQHYWTWNNSKEIKELMMKKLMEG